jgi:hypothetical protein
VSYGRPRQRSLLSANGRGVQTYPLAPSESPNARQGDDVERRIRILMAIAGVNGLLAIGALGLIVWMNEDPVYWFPKLASAQGPKGQSGDRGARGPQGSQGPAGISGDVELDSRVADLETEIGSDTSVDDLATQVSDHDDRIGTVETDVTDLQDRMDAAESSLADACSALDSADDFNLNGAC